MTETHLPDLENRAYRSVMDDGIVDLIIGAVIVGLGFTVATDLDFLSIVVVVIAPMLWRYLRRNVVEPRQGYVRLQESRVKEIQRRKRLFWTTLFVLAVALWTVDRKLDHQFPILNEYRFLWVGLLFTGMVGFAGRLFDMPRYYLYAAAGMVSVTAAAFLDGPDSLGFFTAGGVMMAGGLWLLLRIANEPVVGEDA